MDEKMQPLTPAETEDFINLVYDMRDMQRQYFMGGRMPHILDKAKQLEKQVDREITKFRTRKPCSQK